MESVRDHSSHCLHSVAKETTRSQDNIKRKKTKLYVVMKEEYLI